MKKTLKAAICCFLLVFALSGVLSFLTKKDTNVAIADNSIYNHSLVSQRYEDNVVLSVEKVTVPNNPPTGVELEAYKDTTVYGGGNPYSTYYFKNISRIIDGNWQSKHIVRDNEFAMLNDTLQASYTEQIMVAFGSYFFSENDNLFLNASAVSNPQKIRFLNVSATLDGEQININANRQYNSQYFDFVMFLDAARQGFYEFTFTYMTGNTPEEASGQKTRTFGFYVLAQSTYTNPKTVNGQVYTVQPAFETGSTTVEAAAESLNYLNNQVNYFNYDNTNNAYPTLTYDCNKYALSYRKILLDTLTQVEFNYNPQQNKLIMSSTTLGKTTYKEYPITSDNTIVSLVFADLGEYVFSSNVIYYDDAAQIEVDANQVAVKNQKLVIYGSNAVYSKVNTYQAQFKRMQIVENGTTCIVVGGYKADESFENPSLIKLGVLYETINAPDKKTGEINELNSADSFVETQTDFTAINKAEYNDPGRFVQTNQGPAWLDVNVEVSYFAGSGGQVSAYSHYYYAKDLSSLQSANVQELKKGQTFGSVGYYIVAVRYNYKRTDMTADRDVSFVQVFAFRISSKGLSIVMNSTPSGELENAVNDPLNKIISSGNYTNNNIFLTWNKSGHFDTPISIRYWFSSAYETDKDKMTAKNVEYSSVGIVNDLQYGNLFKNSGTYVLQANYGKSFMQEYRFTIDKDEISGISLMGVTAQKTSVSGINYIYDGTVYNQGAIDKMVTLSWNDKPSGASIKAEYCFTPFVENVASASKFDLVNGNTWIGTNYELGTTSPVLAFEKALQTTHALNKNYILSAQGIYTFKIYDDAGNYKYYMVVIDKTSSKFVQNPTSDSIYNLTTDNTTVTWGSHKVFSLFAQNDETTQPRLFEFLSAFYENDPDFAYYTGTYSNKDNIKELFKIYNNNFYFAVKNTKVVIEKNGKTLEKNIISNDPTTHKTTYNISQTGDFSGEGVYFAYALSENQIYKNAADGSQTAINYKSSRSLHMVELNRDNSLGMIYGLNADGKFNARLKDSQTDNGLSSDITAKKQIVFEWIEGEGDYKVESLTYSFYPFATDESDVGNYYPYAANPTIENVNLLIDYITLTSSDVSGQPERIGKFRSKPFNLTYETYFDEAGNLVTDQVTASGMYVVTRTYRGENANDRVRSYRFYVDRNGIMTHIETDGVYTRNVGKHIEVQMQNGAKKLLSYTKVDSTKKVNYVYIDSNTGTEYTKKASTILETNLLPVKVLIPLSKYMSKFSGVTTNSGILGFGLSVNVYYRDSSSPVLNIKLKDSIPANLTAQGFYVNLGSSNEFTIPGTYIIEITDGVGETFSGQTSGNVLLFAISVVGKKPTADIYGKPSSAGEVANKLFSGESIAQADRTTDEHLTVVIDDPEDIYKAKVDINNITIWRRPLGADETSYVRYYQNVSGVIYPIGSHENVYSKTAIGTYSGTDLQEALSLAQTTGDYSDIRYRHTYKLNLKDPTKPGEGTITVDANGNIISYLQYVYKISIQYIGQLSSYQYVNEQGNIVNYYSNDLYVVVDRSPSAVNLDNLIAAQANDILAHYPEFETADEIKAETAYRHVYGDEDFFEYNDYYSTSLSERYSFAVKGSTPYTNLLNGNADIERVYHRKLYISEQDFIDLLDTNGNGVIDPEEDQYTLAKKLAMGKAALLPGDSRYYAPYGQYEDYIRFSEASATVEGYSVVSEGLRSADTFGKLIPLETNYGYYEIIEKDIAGNFTSYVVLLKVDNTAANDITINAKCTDTAIEDRNINPTESLFAFEINSINNIDYFSKIVINQTIDTTTTTIFDQYTNFETDMAALVTQINDLINYGRYEIIVEGRFGVNARFVVTIYDSNSALNRNAIKVFYNETDRYYYITPGDAINKDMQSNLEFTIQQLVLVERTDTPILDNQITTDLGLWNSNVSSSISEPYYCKLDLTNVPNWKNVAIRLRAGKFYTLNLIDVLGRGAQDSEKITLSTSTDTLEGEDFYTLYNQGAEAVPNADASFTLGTGKKVYSANYLTEDNFRFAAGEWTYTTKPIVISYLSAHYKDEDIKITRYNSSTGEDEDVKDLIAADLLLNAVIYKQALANGITNLIFMPPTFVYNFLSAGGAFKYKVALRDFQGVEKKYDFVIDNTSPALTLKDMQNNNKNSIASAQRTTSYTSTADPIFITWENFSNQQFSYKVILEKRVLRPDGSLGVESFDITDTQKDGGYLLSPYNNQEGSYILHFYTYNPVSKQLLEDRYFAFTIRLSDMAMYYITYADNDEELPDKAQSQTTWKEIKEYTALSTLKDDIKEQFPKTKYTSLTPIDVYMSTRDLMIVTNADKSVEMTCIVAPAGSQAGTPATTKYYEKNVSGYEIYLYRINSLPDSEYVFEELVCVVKVPVSSDNIVNPTVGNGKLLKFFSVWLNENNRVSLISDDSKYTWLPEADADPKLFFNTWNMGNADNTSSGYKNDVFAMKNKLIVDVYYLNGELVNSIYASAAGVFDLPDQNQNITYSVINFLSEGEYTLQVRDLAGNRVAFGKFKSNSFVLRLLTNLILTLNDMPVPENAYYNGTVVAKIKNSNNYKANSITFTALQNGKPAVYQRTTSGNDFVYTFTQAGTYVVRATAKYAVSKTEEIEVSKNFVFTIINGSEARVALDFTNIYNAYQILSVVKNGQDITEKFIDLLSVPSTDDFYSSQLITYERLISSKIGAGKFILTYRINRDELLPSQDIAFNFWINNETPSIVSSISDGEATTKPIKIMYNAYIIHQQIGDCYIMINNVIYANINSDTATNNSLSEITLTTANDYFVQVVTDSGRVISSFRVTKNDPLNTVSIILIVIGSVLLVGGVTVFIVLRKRMRVR